MNDLRRLWGSLARRASRARRRVRAALRGRPAAAEQLEPRTLLVGPVAVNDSFALAEDATLPITPASLLANDSDADNNALSVLLAVGSGPTKGTLRLGEGGNLLYTPNANFGGTDSFAYRAFDGQEVSN